MLVRLLTTLAAAIALTGCGGGGEGNPPNGDIRAFNAASGFGPLSFLRVERVEAVLPYKADSGFISVDQDDYNFNIEVARPGSSERRRTRAVKHLSKTRFEFPEGS